MIGLIHSKISDYQTHKVGNDDYALSFMGSGTFSSAYKYNKEIGVGPWTAIPGAILAIYDPPGGLSVTSQYRRVTIPGLYGVDRGIVLTNTVIVTVLATVTPGSIDADQTTCHDGDPAVFSFLSLLYISSLTVDPYEYTGTGYGDEV